jgi:tetratricopeptide (TPR) repeat protein
MTDRYRISSLRTAGPAVLTFLLMTAIPSPAQGLHELHMVSDRLPTEQIFCPLAGKSVRISDYHQGKPMAVFFTDAKTGFGGRAWQVLVREQANHGSIFTWVGVFVGRGEADEILRRQEEESGLRFDHRFHDINGAWLSALGVKTLPVLVLINEDEYITGRKDDFRRENDADIASACASLAQSCRMKGRSIHDFKLPEVGSDRLLTLLDVARRDYTMLLFLETNCVNCFYELGVLEEVRNRYLDWVGLAAVFQDKARPERIEQYLDSNGLKPDFVLFDPMMYQHRVYNIDILPVLFVIGPDGTIIYSRKGFRADESKQLAEQLERLFWDESVAAAASAFKQCRHIHLKARKLLEEGKGLTAVKLLTRILELYPELYTVHDLLADAYLDIGKDQEAVHHYNLYLTSEPEAYDAGQVGEKIKALAVERKQER